MPKRATAASPKQFAKGKKRYRSNSVHSSDEDVADSSRPRTRPAHLSEFVILSGDEDDVEETSEMEEEGAGSSSSRARPGRGRSRKRARHAGASDDEDYEAAPSKGSSTPAIKPSIFTKTEHNVLIKAVKKHIETRDQQASSSSSAPNVVDFEDVLRRYTQMIGNLAASSQADSDLEQHGGKWPKRTAVTLQKRLGHVLRKNRGVPTSTGNPKLDPSTEAVKELQGLLSQYGFNEFDEEELPGSKEPLSFSEQASTAAAATAPRSAATRRVAPTPASSAEDASSLDALATLAAVGSSAE